MNQPFVKFLRPSFLLAFAVTAALFAPADAPIAGGYAHRMLPDNHDIGAPMTDQAMAQWVRDYYATHPEVRPAAAQGTPVVTFKAFSLNFDMDGNVAGTPVDTAYIMVGEIVGWQRLIGSHTVTSGDSSNAVDAGALFDVPLDAANPVFTYQFDQAGTFPFFCRTHEAYNMRGVVIVQAPVGVAPLTGDAGAIGFTGTLAPNPTQSGTSFRFAMRERGPARAIVLDASGRLVANVLDQILAPGTYGATWDGRDRAGRRAGPGVYFVRLMLPGYQSAQRVVVAQ